MIIDSHMHVYRTAAEGLRDKEAYQIWEYGEKDDVHYSQYPGVVADALKALEEAGASRAVVVNLFAVSLEREHALAGLPPGLSGAAREEAIRGIDATMGERLRASNHWLCDEAAKHAQIVPFIAVDPGVLTPEENVAHIREMVGRGARGLKLHPVLQGFSPDDQRMLPVYETCVQLGIPIVSHSGPAQGNWQYAEPRAFAAVLAAFPRLTLVLAHLGGGAYRQLPEIARRYPNATFDCCEIIEWTGGSTAPTDRELAQLILEVGPERVMMGTDFPWYDVDHTAQRVRELPLLSDEQKEGILGANAVRILGL